MRSFRRTGLMIALTGLALSGCGILGGGQPTAQPPTLEAQAITAAPTDTPTPAPTLQPTALPTAGPGDVVFVNGGQVWAIGADGTGLRPLTALPEGAAIQGLSVSPDGKYLAYSINASLAEVFELATGKRATIDFANKSRVESFVWPPDGSAVYYHKLILDDNSAPFRSQIWKVDMPPGGAPERVFEADLATEPMSMPVAALDGGQVVIHQFRAGGADSGSWTVYNSGTDASTPIEDGYGLWDAWQGSQLLFKKDEVTPGHLTIPIRLYLSTSDATAKPISPLDDDSAAYTGARFSPDGNQIAVLRFTQDAAGVTTSGAAMLSLGDIGAFQLTLIAAEPATRDVAVVWADATHLVIQRLRGTASELWLVPTDGSAGKLLATGEQPQVVGGR